MGLARRSSSEVIWRLRGRVPSRHTRVSSAPKTVSTAPPARTPSTWVRPLVFVRAASAAFRRLALRCDTLARPPAQVGVGELLHEDDAELEYRPDALAGARCGRAEGRQLLGEVLRADHDDPAGDDLLGVALADVALQDVGEERRRVLPDVEALVVGDELEARHRQGMPDAVLEPQAVEHVLDAGCHVDEQVEPPLLPGQPAAERVALHPALGDRGAQGIAAEALDVLHLDRQVELEVGGAFAAGLRSSGEIRFTESHVAEHLLGEANGCGHRTAASATRRSGSMI